MTSVIEEHSTVPGMESMAGSRGREEATGRDRAHLSVQQENLSIEVVEGTKLHPIVRTRKGLASLIYPSDDSENDISGNALDDMSLQLRDSVMKKILKELPLGSAVIFSKRGGDL